MLNRDLLQRARTARVALSLTLAFGFISGILAALQAKTFSHIINAAFLQHNPRPSLTPAFLTLLALISLRALSAALSETLADRAARRIKHQLRRDLLQHLQRLPPHHTQQNRTGSLTNTLTEAIESLDPYLREYLPQLAQASLLPAALLLLILPRDPISGSLLLLTGPLIPIFMALIGSMAQRATQKQWRSLNRLSTHFWDVLHGLTTLKLFNRSHNQTAAIHQASQQHRRLTLNVLRLAFTSALALELLSTLSTALIAVGIGIRLLYGQLNFEDALFVLLLAPEFYLPLRLLGTRFHAGITGNAAAQEIFAALSTPVPPTPANSAQPPNPPLPITFDNVTYTHPGDTQPTLHNLNFSLQAGRTIALVGPSGAGKTTLANLLLGFIQPTSGRILIGGVPLQQIDPNAWRAQIGWVPQTPYLLQDTLQANLLLAKPHATPTQLENAAQKACLLPVIHNLPHGWHTPLGENGTRLSSGEAQRLALARAFLKDAPILILDEATSALDPALDAEIQTALATLRTERATLLIAHRLHTAIHADQILVLNHGQIVQSGTHHQLLQETGLYRDLWHTYQRETAPLPQPATLPAPVTHNTPPTITQPGSVWQETLRLLRPHAPAMLLAIALGSATTLSGIGLMATSAYIIAKAALQPGIEAIQVAVVGVRFFGLSRGIFRYLERLSAHNATFQILADLRTWFYQKLEPLAPARLLTYHTGDLLSRILHDVETLQNLFVRGIAPVGAALLSSLAAGWLLAAFYPPLALTLWLFLLLAGIALPLFLHRATKENATQLQRQRARLTTLLIDHLRGLPDLLTFNAHTEHLARCEQASQQLGALQTRMAHWGALQSGALVLLSHLAMSAVLWQSLPRVQTGQLDGVWLAALALSALASFEAVQTLPLAAAHLESSLEAMRRLLEVIAPQNAAVPVIVPPPLEMRVPPRLAVRALTFGYPGSARDALHGVTFNLREGEHLAVVGASGSGKSTLTQILLRFWDSYSGGVYLDGCEIRTLNAETVRAAFAVVSPQTHLFYASIRENLLLARPHASAAEIETACRAAQLHEWIMSLPDGYETLIGEGGARLSGGERQRLALARALLKDAPILILDEATAHLDAHTEDALLAALRGRTLLRITHRPHSLATADTVLLLHNGQVVK